MSNKFQLESDEWPGLAKVIEEMTELATVLAKLVAVDGTIKYYDGTNLITRVIEEAADVYAALTFFCNHNLTEHNFSLMLERRYAKLNQFNLWRNKAKE